MTGKTGTKNPTREKVMKSSKTLVLLFLALIFGWTAANAQTAPPAARLWLGFNTNEITDSGTSTAGHVITTVNNLTVPYAGVITNDVANGTCGTSNLFLPGDGSLVEVDHASDLNFNTGSPFSISAWIKPQINALGNRGGVIAAKSTLSAISGATGTHTFAFYLQPNGTLRADLFWVGDVATSQTVPTNVWTHVALTYNGSTFQIFTNGVQLLSASAGGSANEGANNEAPWSFTVGATLNTSFPNDNGAFDPFTGEIDEVAVWDKALTTNQVAEVYAQGVPAQTVNITQEPANANAFGGPASFTVAAAPVGIGALSYQWQSNGISINPVTEPTAATATYTTPPTTNSFNGAQYQCVITGGSVSVVSSAATLTYVTPISPLGALLWLPFEGNLNEKGGVTHTVSLSGAATYPSDVAAGHNCGTKSLLLTGDGSYVLVTNIPDLNFNSYSLGGGPFTISAWFKPTGSSVILAKSYPAANGTLRTMALYVNDTGQVEINAYGFDQQVSAHKVTMNQWNHVAFTYDGFSGGNWKIYLNGVLDATLAHNSMLNEPTPVGTWPLTIGNTLATAVALPGMAANPPAPFNGGIDEVAVWGSALNANQVASVYVSGVPLISLNFSVQPAPVNVFTPNTATFTATAVAQGVANTVTYQWLSNNVVIPGASGTTYTTPPTTASFNGVNYSCWATAGFLSTTSNPALLTAITPSLPTAASLWLPFENSLADSGHSVNVHAASGQNASGPYAGVLTNDVANAPCGTNSLYLPGDGSFVQVTNVGDLDFNSGSPFTVSAWIKTTSGGCVLAKSPTALSPGNYWTYNTPSLYIDNGGILHWDVYFVGAFASPVPVNSGQWTHVAVTYSGSSYTMYVNGFAVATSSFGAADEGANADAGTWLFTVGASDNPNYPLPGGPFSAFFDGEIDEVTVWGNQLSAGQVADVYLSGVPTAAINITQQPAATTSILAGDTATFTAAAEVVGSSSPLNYQWLSNSVIVASGPTLTTYTTPPLNASADGAVYQCKFTAGTLNALSVDAVLSVVTPTPPPQPALWLPLNGNYQDYGTGSATHQVEEVAGLGSADSRWINPVSVYDGVFTNSVGSPFCGTNSLSLAGDSSFIIVTNVSDCNVSNAFTVTAWINMTNSLEGIILSKALNSAYTLQQFCLYVGNGGQLNFDNFYGGGVSQPFSPTNGWYHVACTYDTNKNATLYINGFQVATGPGSGTAPLGNEGAGGTSPWAIGIGCSLNTVDPNGEAFSGGIEPSVADGELTTSDSLNGRISQVAFWNSALAGGQIYYVYAHGIPPTLKIGQSDSTHVTVTWPGGGYKLQQNNNLANPAGWSDVPGGGTSGVPVNIGAGSQFFRLVPQ